MPNDTTLAYARSILPDLPTRQAQVLYLLAKLADQTHSVTISMAELAALTGMTRPTAKWAVQALLEKGLLHRERQESAAYGYVANRYTFAQLALPRPLPYYQEATAPSPDRTSQEGPALLRKRSG